MIVVITTILHDAGCAICAVASSQSFQADCEGIADRVLWAASSQARVTEDFLARLCHLRVSLRDFVQLEMVWFLLLALCHVMILRWALRRYLVAMKGALTQVLLSTRQLDWVASPAV